MQPRWTALLVVALIAAGLTVEPDSAGADDPRRVWKTVESEHFIVHYYEPLDAVARRIAVVAERAHETLVPVFGHAPETKTIITLVDDTDGANGFANTLPRNAITLYATAPSGASALNDHDDWLYGLVAHEYSHVLHLDTMSGLPRLYNAIFGKRWAPNQVQPRWVIEGIATYQETKRSAGGRARNTQFDMYLRRAVLAGDQLRLDEMSNAPSRFPRGNAAYLYGSMFLDYIFDRYGDDKLRVMTHAYGATPVPYGINKAIEQATGRRFVDLYDEWVDWMRARYGLQRQAVERRGLREGHRLTFSAENNLAPMYSHDGQWIVWLQSDGVTRARLRELPVGGNIGGARDYATLDKMGAFDLLSDGSVVFEQGKVYRSNYSYQELVLWDRASGEETAITHGARARDPSASPDERWVAFSMNGESSSALALVPLRTEAEPRVLWRGEGRYDQAYNPAWSPDGKTIAFSAWRSGGRRDVLLVDVGSGKVTALQDDRAIDGDPVWSPDGAVLYFTSDRTGISNLYALELTSGRLRQVTNVLGGAFEPAISPDGKRMAYHGFNDGGYDLYEIELDPARWLEPEPYVDDRPAPTEIPDNAHPVSAPRPYRALETLAPKAWAVSMATSSFGSAVSVDTAAGDSAGLHGYTVAATVGLDRGDVSAGASYGYAGLWPSLRLGASRSVSRRGGLRLDGNNTRYTEDTVGATASIGLPALRSTRGSVTVSLDYDIDWFRNTDDDYRGPDPDQMIPGFPETDVVATGVALRASYSDSRGTLYAVGPQEGQELSASLRFDHPALGGDFRGLTLNWSFRTYWRMPWGVTPTMSLRYAGGLRTGDQARVGNFGLGGVPEQNVVDAVLQSLRAANTGFLRGYEPRAFSGSQFHLINLEYRHQVLEIERGIATLPFYVKRLHVAGLFDVGTASNDPLAWGEIKPSLGGALRLDAIFGFFVPGSFEVGYARGLASEGIDEYWMLLTGTL